MELTDLILEGTKLDEGNGIELLKTVLSLSKVKRLNLSRNMTLSYKFSAFALYLIRTIPDFCLEDL